MALVQLHHDCVDRRRDRARTGRGRPAGAALRLRPQGQREDVAQLPNAGHAHLQRRRTHEREAAETKFVVSARGVTIPLLIGSGSGSRIAKSLKIWL